MKFIKRLIVCAAIAVSVALFCGPASPTVTYDMLQWFRNPNWKVSHLEGTAQDGSTVKQYVYDTGHNLIYTKTGNGYPWDVKSYDSNWIYDWITEMDWTSPNDYKANTPLMKMVPRYWNGNNSWSHSDGSITVDFFQGCKIVKTGANTVSFSLTGPYAYNFGGNVGTLQTIRVNYQWSPNDLEQLYLTTQHGWVLWKYYHNGVLKQFSLHNKVVQGSLTPIFGCGRIP